MLRWFKDNAWWLLLILVGVLGFCLAKATLQKNAGSVDDLVKDLKHEKEIIDEKAKVAKLVAQQGHQVVAEQIKKDHEERIAKMDDSDKQKVEELSNDPEALVEHLLRITA